jgi:acyl-CoA thioesterase I
MSSISCRSNSPIRIAVASLLISLQASAVTIRIQPLGDSITVGGGNPPPAISYRYPLFKLLTNASMDFEYVGSLTDYSSYPPVNGRTMSQNHDGHWGFEIQDINAGLSGWMNGYMPDFSIILLGTNDITVGESVAQGKSEMSTTIDLLRAKNPRIVIFLGLLYQSGSQFAAYNAEYVNLANTRSTKDSPIIPVGPPPGWNNAACTVDGTHPNAAGADLLAATFFAAIKPYLISTGALLADTPPDKEKTTAIKVFRSGDLCKIRLPMQRAHLDIVNMRGELISSQMTTNGRAVFPVKKSCANYLLLRVNAPGYSSIVPIP